MRTEQLVGSAKQTAFGFPVVNVGTPPPESRKAFLHQVWGFVSVHATCEEEMVQGCRMRHAKPGKPLLLVAERATLPFVLACPCHDVRLRHISAFAIVLRYT